MKVWPPSSRFLILHPAGNCPPVARVGEAFNPVLEAGPGILLPWFDGPEGVPGVEGFLGLGVDGLGVEGLEFLTEGEDFAGIFLVWFAP